eukprot:Gregarina_sp_Pseudo_9__88@NODE_105_length_4255_cov_23_264231_g97_i0_p2_GENE_NODE_105_length_4255_cov_23_264231_g97_i0NODE_105_length_4255_cov_23_264231_g97_i0_p2_ORF_typecomplete_len662_score159_35ARS2/PF04959_13/2_8e18DUF3546/PF12066_8/7_4e10GSH_synthase/PF03199_15/0_21DUF629/PF04780_12/0_31zfBED/PF02892_15/0_91_NODE_105_length_4255_cov_23_264231_g97_i022034188
MQSPELSNRRRRSGSTGGGRNASGYLLPPPPPTSGAGPANPSVVLAPVFERFHSFKEFMLLQKDTLEAERAVQLYDQYRYDFKIHTARMLFSQHQDLGFLKQRFDPVCVRTLVVEKTQLVQAAAPNFLEAFSAGALNTLCLTVPLEDPKMLSQLIVKDPVPCHRVIGTWATPETLTEDVTQSPFYGVNPNKYGRSLVLRKLPGTLTRADIVDACGDAQGLTSVTLIPSCLTTDNQKALLVQSRKESGDCSEAELANLERAVTDCYVKSKGSLMIPLQTAWLEFDTEENCAAAELALEKRPVKDFCTLSPFKIHPKTAAPIRVCSLSTQTRTTTDFEQVSSLILRLDREFSAWGLQWPPHQKMEERMDKQEEKKDKGDGKPDDVMGDDDVQELGSTAQDTEAHPLLKAIAALPVEKKLDICLLYLRRIHFMDYYSAKFCWTERELFETSGAATIRLASDVSDVVVIDDPSAEYLLQSEDSARFDKKIQSLLGINWVHWRTPIDDYHPLFADLWSRFCEEKTMLVDAEKYRCGICRKLFKGAEFVHKHLKNKHIPEVEPVRNGVSSMLMKQAFEADDQKLLLFVQPSEDFQKAFQSIRPMPTVQMRNSDSYVPLRRNKPSHRGGPSAFLNSERPYRDWDAPRTRLVEKSAGGNFRTMMRYDDL